MAFLDSEQEQIAPRAPQPPRRRESGPERRRRQFVVRRLIAVGFGLLLLGLVVFGLRSCLEARSDRGLRNYTQDVGTIMAESEQYGKDFFDTLADPGALSEQQLEQQIFGIRGASERLLGRATDLNAPDQMREANSAVELSLRLRRDAMQVIAESIGGATANAETAPALLAIQQQMGSLYASDILWRQEARPEVEKVLKEEEVDGPDLPQGNFMPPPEQRPEEFLTQQKLTELISSITGQDASSGTSGLALAQTSIGGTTLSADSTTTVASDAREIQVQVENQGDSEQTGIQVNITVGDEEVTEELPALKAGESAVAKGALTSLPAPGTEVEVTVVVQPVPGEVDSSNNQASYTVVFGDA